MKHHNEGSGNRKLILENDIYGKVYYDPSIYKLTIYKKVESHERMRLHSPNDIPSYVYLREGLNTIRSATWHKDGSIHRRIDRPAYVQYRKNRIIEHYYLNGNNVDETERQKYLYLQQF